MPKVYVLKGLMELLRMKERQDAKASEPPDWALLEKVQQIRDFFKSPGPGVGWEAERATGEVAGASASSEGGSSADGGDETRAASREAATDDPG